MDEKNYTQEVKEQAAGNAPAPENPQATETLQATETPQAIKAALTADETGERGAAGKAASVQEAVQSGAAESNPAEYDGVPNTAPSAQENSAAAQDCDGADSAEAAQKTLSAAPKTARGYTIAACVLGAVLAAGLAFYLLVPTAWAYAGYPLLAGVAVAFLWCFVARVFFCRAPERYLVPDFRRALKLSFAVPFWLACTLGFFLLPGNIAVMDEALMEALVVLLLLVWVTVAPVAAIVCGILGIRAGWKHMQSLPRTESALYREGPFALSLLMMIAMAAGSLFLVLYFVL